MPETVSSTIYDEVKTKMSEENKFREAPPLSLCSNATANEQVPDIDLLLVQA